ncbi:molybdopterin oxidoreductase family protein [Kocuria sp.]|uniref:molybdopterin oxidoreductase family protein n=1 Tax=Kocuria sp. TaxID=1871328 RepID=UPI0026E0CB66|nr:molybdopterin oxidoreductase family protein [Kocuria sp.]MDO5619096.1 molybdopterin oxidoreductase family protein [Kocuria sp.]
MSEPAGVGKSVASHCPYCALQCAITLTRGRDGVELAARQFPTNRGGLCRKGWTAAELLDHPDRLTRPLRRVGTGPEGQPRWEAIEWAAALDLMVAQFTAAQHRHGLDAVGIFGGASLTTERAYQLGKFARIALRTSRIDYNGRFCMSSAAAAANAVLGLDRGLPFPLQDLDDAHTVLVIGSNPAQTMPPLIRHLAQARKCGGLVVIDPRHSATAALTDDGGGVHLAPRPGTDVTLLLGLAHVILRENRADTAFLEDRTTGQAAVRAAVAQWWPERVESVTGVAVADLYQAAHLLCRQRRGTYVLTGRGAEQHVDGVDTVMAAINLALLLGLPGREGSGWGTLTGQGNGQGAREHGQKADQLPGYRSISDPTARAHVAAVWGVDPSIIPGPGIPAAQLLTTLGTAEGVKALWVNGSNIVVSAPDALEVQRGLGRLDFLVVSDFFLSETALQADLVLPVPQWAEEEGTMTNLEGRVLRRRQLREPPGDVRDELWILAELARRLKAPGTFSTDAAEVFSELARASAGGKADYSGLSHQTLDALEGPRAHQARQWPVTAQAPSGTPRMFLQRFAHADGKAHMQPVEPRTPAQRAALGVRHDRAAITAPPAPTDTNGPVLELTMTTGRLLEHYQSGTQTRRVASLTAAAPRCLAHLHPTVAARLGVSQDDDLVLASQAGQARAAVAVDPEIPPHTVFLPFHFGGEYTVNRLITAVVDPVSGMPEFKAVQVRVARAAQTVRSEHGRSRTQETPA